MASEVLLFNNRTCQFRIGQCTASFSTVQHNKCNLPWTAQQLFNETIIRKCPKVQQSSQYQYSMEYETKRNKFQKHRWKSNNRSPIRAPRKIKTNKPTTTNDLCENIKNVFSKNIENNTFRKILVNSSNVHCNCSDQIVKWKTNFQQLAERHQSAIEQTQCFQTETVRMAHATASGIGETTSAQCQHVRCPLVTTTIRPNDVELKRCQERNQFNHTAPNANQQPHNTFICQHRNTLRTATAGRRTMSCDSTTEVDRTRRWRQRRPAVGHTGRLFTNMQKIMRIFLPILLVVNMFSYTEAGECLTLRNLIASMWSGI
jgi:hypothetical protein